MMTRLRSRQKTNPVFYAERLRRMLAHDEERVEQIFADSASVDLLTWNVFASLDSDGDREYLAGVLRPLAGGTLRSPIRISLWSGRQQGPDLRPSGDYAAHIRSTVGEDVSAVAEFLAPIEVPVRIETPDHLVLVETTLEGLRRGEGGRDRVLELLDAGLAQAHRVDKELVLSVVYRSGTLAAAELSNRLNRLRDPKVLAQEMPWREAPPKVRILELPWQQLLRIWENERSHLALGGEPVRRFLDHTAKLGLR